MYRCAHQSHIKMDKWSPFLHQSLYWRMHFLIRFHAKDHQVMVCTWLCDSVFMCSCERVGVSLWLSVCLCVCVLTFSCCYAAASPDINQPHVFITKRTTVIGSVEVSGLRWHSALRWLADCPPCLLFESYDPLFCPHVRLWLTSIPVTHGWAKEEVLLCSFTYIHFLWKMRRDGPWWYGHEFINTLIIRMYTSILFFIKTVLQIQVIKFQSQPKARKSVKDCLMC